ncbi:MAG: hypothetical protein K6U02_03275 [Firmicutes bacterium]|nr:hypothetical protein [Bacillota bacterium]
MWTAWAIAFAVPLAILAGPQGPPRARVSLAEDRGTLQILQQGRLVGSESFQIAASSSGWIARGETELQLEGTPGKVRSELRLHPDGSPERYEWTVEGQNRSAATVRFSGTTAQVDLRVEGVAPFQQEFFFNAQPVLILDNNLYHQYAILAALYDWKRGGEQSFSVLVPQSLTPGAITVEAFVPAENPSEKKLQGLRVRSADLELEVYLDDGRRLIRLAVPSAGVEIVRK